MQDSRTQRTPTNPTTLMEKEKTAYVCFDPKTGTTRISESPESVSSLSYRKVHETNERFQADKLPAGRKFEDPEYTIDLNELRSLDEKRPNVIIKRLYELYRLTPKNNKPQFFPNQNYTLTNIKNQHEQNSLPTFITEIGILPVVHYKSLFVTQNFVENGLYTITINQNGRFETDVVDDRIPVYEDSLEPIWGLSIESAWQIILLKFWAKKNRSYLNVKKNPPFKFIQFFTNSNWKYFNLQKQGLWFLDMYSKRIQNGFFVLKTKNSAQVAGLGLTPNSAGYSIVGIHDETPNITKLQDKRWVITIKSTLINRWAGSMSILDKRINEKYNKTLKQPISLQRDFIVDQLEFINLFSAAYVASKRENSLSYSSYCPITVPANNKESIYLKFNVKREGWLDFCIKQFSSNRVELGTEKSRLRSEDQNNVFGNENDGCRFIKVKFILVKDNKTVYSSGIKNQVDDYNLPQYEAYEIDYLHGYNRGDARFEQIHPGIYYLKIKPEKIDQPSTFVVNYASDSQISMERVNLDKNVTGAILRQSMASLIERLPSHSLDETKNEEITLANLFQEVGYGFVGVRMKRRCLYKILIEIDPAQVNKSGYKLKNQFKNLKEPFTVLVQAGECTSVVFKKVNPNAQWPPAGIEIFRSK